MPQAIDPSQTFEIVLESDEGKPEAERPCFVFHYLSVRDWRNATATADKIAGLTANSTNSAEVLDVIFETIQIGLVGWRNMGEAFDGKEKAFDPADLDALLTPGELFELFNKMLSQGFGADDLKNSESPSASAAG